MKIFRLFIFLFLALVSCSVLSPTTEPLEMPPGKLGSTYKREADGMRMVYVPAGEFRMGSVKNYDGAVGEETPLHWVTLSGFWIDQTPVTNAQYKLCVDAGACKPPRRNNSWHREYYYDNENFANYPVIYVDWKKARTFCTWVGAHLPTEAQWECAARGLRSNLYPWGNTPPKDSLLTWAQPGGDTAKVDAHPKGRSWVGALGMAGNVWEWTADWYGEYSEDFQENPTGPEKGKERVTHGGSFLNGREGIRSSSRNPLEPGFDSYPFVGFRCAAELSE